MGTSRSKPKLPSLHRDELHCVFDFLEWRELLQCARSCRLWLDDAAALLPSRALTVTVSSREQAELLLRSPLRAHIAALQGALEAAQLQGSSASFWPLLAAVASRLPQLQRLELQLPLSELDCFPVVFSSRLQVLQLHICADSGAPVELTVALERFTERLVGVVPPSLRSLSIQIKNDDGMLPLPLVALSALAKIDSLTALHIAVDWNDSAVRALCRGLPQLRSLRREARRVEVEDPNRSLSVYLDSNGSRVPLSCAALSALARIDSLTALHIAVDWNGTPVRALCRVLPQLRSLHRVAKYCDFPAWSTESLAQLTQGELGVDYPPLESLGLIRTLDAEALPLLLRLPSLTELHVGRVEVEDLQPLLVSLPSLRSLHLETISMEIVSEAWWSRFARALPQCPQITALALASFWLKDDHLAAIVAALPLLQSLTVTRSRLRSLRCFAETAHLARTLQRLTVESLRGFSVSELDHLRPLRALRELRVKRLSDSGWMLSNTRARLTPGHARFDRDCWPHLRTVELEFD